MTNATDKLITYNLGYVITLARQYQSDILTTDDLISEGTIGMMRAAEKFDPSRGKPFVTFAAPYIRHSIETAIARLESGAEVRSTDESLPVGSRNSYTLLNVLEDTNAAKTDAALEQASLSDELVRAMGVLNERERMVVSRFFGIDTPHETLAEIGMGMGLRRERIRQIRDLAVRKLRKEAKSGAD